MKLPPYIYQLIDHIYISDSRSIIYASKFDLIINTSHIKEPCIIEQTKISNTLFVNLIKDQTGKSCIENKNILFNLIKSTKLNRYILLYSDTYDDSCDLFINYLIDHYHFTKEDIYRMIISRPMNNELKKSMEKELNKKE